MRTHYRFDHSWQVDAGADAVLALLEDVRGYGAWWPAVRVTGGAPVELRAAIAGDLDGRCSWRVEPEAGGTRIEFTQEVEVRARLLRAVSPLLHGVLARQHAAVVRSAERGLRAALLRG